MCKQLPQDQWAGDMGLLHALSSKEQGTTKPLTH